MTVLCQWCGAANPDGRELCLRCNERLIVVSGAAGRGGCRRPARRGRPRRGRARRSTSTCSSGCRANEEAIKRLQPRPPSRVEERVTDLERSVSLLDAGVQALVELLDRRKVVRENEVIAAWERAATSEMAREELLDRLRERREVIVSRARTAGARRGATRAARALQTRRAGAARRAARARRARCSPRRCGAFPRNPELAALIGELAFERGDLAAAERYFRQVIRWRRAANVDARIYLGHAAGRHRARGGGAASISSAPLRRRRRASCRTSRSVPARLGGAARRRRASTSAIAVQREPVPQVLLPARHGRAGGRPCRCRHRRVRARRRGRSRVRGRHLLPRPRVPRAGVEPQGAGLLPARAGDRPAAAAVPGGGAPHRGRRAGAPPMPAEAELLVREASAAAESGQIERAWQQLQTRHPTHRPPEPARLAGAARRGGRQAPRRRWPRRTACSGSRWTARRCWPPGRRCSRRCGRRGATAAVRALGPDGCSSDDPEPLERGIAAYELALTELEQRRRPGPGARARPHLARTSSRASCASTRSRRSAASTWRARSTRDAVDYLEQAAALSASPAILTQLGLALLELGEAERAHESCCRRPAAAPPRTSRPTC